MTPQRIMVAAAFMLALVASAQGAVLVTPSNEPAFSGSNYLFCYLTNVGKKPLKGRIEILNPFGVVVSDTGEIIAEPFVQQLAIMSAMSQPSLCRFTVKGSKGSVRTSSCVFDIAVGCTATVEGR